MAKSTVSGVEASMAIQCLDICQELTKQGQTFNFNLKFGSNFAFFLDTRENLVSPETVKKKLSPSSVRRNARRKQEYLMGVLESSG